jgi:polyisoprenyl-teichoic acid--peptidoglycan teichoic acid transferase
VLAQGENGQYYGVEGMTWKAPPILDDPDDEVRMRGRTYQRYFDGRKLRLIAWKTDRGVYWVANTLSKRLTNRQMMDIARSLQRIGQ